MEYKILDNKNQFAQGNPNQLYIIDNEDQLINIKGLSDSESEYIKREYAKEIATITVNQYNKYVFIYYLKPKKIAEQTYEACRKIGAEFVNVFNKLKLESVLITNLSTIRPASMLLGLGMGLANYQFLKYKSDVVKELHTVKTIYFLPDAITETDKDYLNIIVSAICKTRDLVNEPLNYLSAVQLSEEFVKMGADAGFSVDILQKDRIEELQMGGLLAVNRGSQQPPTFTIMEYKPNSVENVKPIVLVGKGIVFDTGGISLKPTLNSMDSMKSDMSGSALVGGTIYAIAKMQLPIHVIALVPATDNRPGENAYVPQDIITMYSGKKVEVLNTDAEGRMVLADALHWAKQYEPELVMDFATLTGAASAAIGEHGIVCMGTASDDIKHKLIESGNRQYERLVEFPMWDEYGDQIKSDVADIKNVGGPTGGAITAGKFLEHFVNYPWMHFDIAGVSFAKGNKGYITTGGTGYGLRMLVDFLMNFTNSKKEL